jgi:hypothetical protein
MELYFVSPYTFRVWLLFKHSFNYSFKVAFIENIFKKGVKFNSASGLAKSLLMLRRIVTIKS